MSLRVATLNCWNVSEPFAERMALIRAGIAALRPDVIGLQEIVVRADGFDQAAVLLDGLGYRHLFGAAQRWNDAGERLPIDADAGDATGNVIATRWPIVRSTLRPLPGEEAGEHRSALAALIETPSGPLPFFTTHLSWKFDHGWIRERQAIAVTDLVARFHDQASFPPILVGDLNAEPAATEIRFLTGLASLGGRSVYFQDAWRLGGNGGPGFTWDNRNRFAALEFEPDRRIDYVLVGKPGGRDGRGRVESARLAFDRPTGTVFPSDHFGVVVDVRA